MISKNNASLPDPIRDLIRKSQERRELQYLQTMITKGTDSGAPAPLDMSTVKQKARARVG